ncbi:hypothetical protein BD779DRAFT_20066 [Infundibulicybe gibba]|nr:hypothetical protein BD779DRAFT_20066 [Infundibulicybe gibba]
MATFIVGLTNCYVRRTKIRSFRVGKYIDGSVDDHIIEPSCGRSISACRQETWCFFWHQKQAFNYGRCMSLRARGDKRLTRFGRIAHLFIVLEKLLVVQPTQPSNPPPPFFGIVVELRGFAHLETRTVGHLHSLGLLRAHPSVVLNHLFFFCGHFYQTATTTPPLVILLFQPLSPGRRNPSRSNSSLIRLGYLSLHKKADNHCFLLHLPGPNIHPFYPPSSLPLRSSTLCATRTY